MEPYKIDEWDDYWDGGQYEVLIVLDGDWEDEEFSEQRIHIARSMLKAESKNGDIYVDGLVIGYWISGNDDFWLDIRDISAYPYFMIHKGKLIYATESFINQVLSFFHIDYTAGIYGILDAKSQ